MAFLPAGFVFNPEPRVLIKEFLIRKVFGLRLPRNEIHEDIDVYLYHPDQLPVPVITSNNSKWGYFFMFRTPENTARCTPGGYWEAIEREKQYIDPKKRKTIAFSSTFAFYEGKTPNGKMTDWMMDEFKLNSELIQLKNHKDPKMDNLVVCKIYREFPEDGEPSEMPIEEIEQASDDSSEAIDDGSKMTPEKGTMLCSKNTGGQQKKWRGIQ